MKQFKNILVAVDTRIDKHPILDEAIAIAKQNGASLKIIDSVLEFGWTVRLTMKDHEHVRELMAQEKQAKLDAMAADATAAGVKTTTKVLWGKTSLEIVREVLRADHDLVMRVAKGVDSRARGFFGSTGLAILRKCPCAVWLVTPETTPVFSHVLGCVDTATDEAADAELNARIYQLASSIAHYGNGKFSIVQARSIWNQQMLKSRMSEEEFDAMVKASESKVASFLDEFLTQQGGRLTDDNVHLLTGEPYDVIPEYINANNVDLVVMGTVARGGLTGAIMGNTAEQILSRIHCSLLALKPTSFVSPVQMDE